MTPTDDAPPVEEMVERLTATDTLPDELHGTRRKTEAYGGGLEVRRFEIRERPPVEFRVETLSVETVREFDFDVDVAFAPTSELDGEAGVVIQNERGLTQYDSETNRYFRYEYEPPEESDGHATGPTLVGSSPGTNFDVTYDGTDTVAGRETHVLAFRPADEAERFYRAFDHVTLRVDGEYWFPLEREAAYDLRNGGLIQPDTDADPSDETYSLTETFEEIAFDTGIEDAAFRFDPPEDAERVE